ncbi:MAG TPA: transcriptional repressor [Dissulfurispiraceae bacterium]|nr:transcriptional repressor [Dissulfurispiraceae bacterium]
MMKYKELGLKLTPQRLSILSCLEGNRDHPTAEDIYRKVSKKFPTMSLATVYNTLETLKRHGKLASITIDPDKKHFDPNLEKHHHLICSSCKKIADIHIDFDLAVPREATQGFQITGSQVEFYGICPECRKKSGR